MTEISKAIPERSVNQLKRFLEGIEKMPVSIPDRNVVHAEAKAWLARAKAEVDHGLAQCDFNRDGQSLFLSKAQAQKKNGNSLRQWGTYERYVLRMEYLLEIVRNPDAPKHGRE